MGSRDETQLTSVFYPNHKPTVRTTNLQHSQPSFTDAKSPIRKVTTRLAICLAIGVTGTSVAEERELFDFYEIDTGKAEHQTVLTGSFLNPGNVELAVISAGAHVTPNVTIFRLEGDEWLTGRDWTLDGDVLFVDQLNVAGRDYILTYRPGTFSRIDMATGTENALVDIMAPFDGSTDAAIPRLNVVHDLNQDGRDDIVMPTTEGFWVSTQLLDGTFSDPVEIGPREPQLDANAYGDERSYGDVGINAQTLPWYLTRVHQLDYDLDGRTDLAFWNESHFEIHRQDTSGQFIEEPVTVTTDVPFDFDGSYALAFQFSDRSVASLLLGLGGRFEYTILQGFPDLNRDGIADLVTLTFSGRRIFSLRGRYDVHFGRATPQGIEFSESPDTSARTPGPAGGEAWGYASQRYVDFDGDGLTDLTMGSVNTGLGGMARAMIGNSISMNLAVYRLEDDAFHRRPDVTKKIQTPFAPFTKRGVLFPTVLSGDVNGDGRMDLLAVERWDELSVYLGKNSPQLLTDEPINLVVEAPTDERFAKVRDLDGNGKDDVFIQYPSATEANRVVVLMAQ